ncbi:MAG: histidinol-phosphate transaminase [Candidatus Heimdallarchaeota archaeon]
MGKVLRSKRVAQIPDTSFQEVPEDFIRMDLAIIKYPPAPTVKEALENSLNSVNEYPPSNWHLLTTKIAKLNNIRKENVLLSNGLDEGIDLITRTFIDPEAKIVIPTPTFAQFEIAALRQEAIPVKLCFLTKQGYKFDGIKIIETVQKENAQLVWICNPNNPTGAVEREKIIEVVENENCLVAVDECYYEFYGKTVIDLVPKYENLLVLRSFTKTYGLAGLRIGFLAGNSVLISQLQKMRQPFSVNLLAQVAALAALENPEYYEEIWKQIKFEKEKIYAQLKTFDLEILPSETNCILIQTPKAKEIFQKLWNNKILVFDGGDTTEFSGLGTNFLRITIGRPEDNALLLDNLTNILN